MKEQIAFADVILLNKIDLMPPEEVGRLEARIRAMNAAASIHRTQNAVVEMDKILNVGGFNLDRALQVDPKFMEPECPFEWGGVYHLPAGTHELVLQEGPDPAMKIALVPLRTSNDGLDAALMEAVLLFSDKHHAAKPGAVVEPGKRLVQLELTGKEARFPLKIARAGTYALYTEHHPDEFRAKLTGPAGDLKPAETRQYKPDHEHDDAVTSVGITTPGDLDDRKLNGWLRDLLMNQGPDIFRMKGVLSLKGDARRFVFQGVHMLFDGRPDRPWGDEPRHNSLIFIGRNLDRARLTEGFRACLA